MKCFEINLLLYDHQSKEFKDIRQYFHQPQGSFRAIKDTLTWVHIQVKRIKRQSSSFVIDRLVIWGWEIAIPSKDGEIKTKKFKERVLYWSFEKGVLDIASIVTHKQQRQVNFATRFLNQYRHIRAEVEIEEIGQELVTEGVTCIAIS